MIKLSGLWKNKSKDGQVYYAGTINKACRLLVFPNKSKTNDGQPDFEVFIDQPRDNKGQELEDDSSNGMEL